MDMPKAIKCTSLKYIKWVCIFGLLEVVYFCHNMRQFYDTISVLFIGKYGTRVQNNTLGQ